LPEDEAEEDLTLDGFGDAAALLDGEFAADFKADMLDRANSEPNG